MLQASNKSQRQYTSYNCVIVPTAWPAAASFSIVALKFLHIIKRKDELICTDLKQDQNTGFPNPSFFLSEVVRSILPLWEGKKEGAISCFTSSTVFMKIFPTLYLPHFNP